MQACFQKYPLDFVRDQQALVLSDTSVVPINGTFVDEGTSPAGSTWAMIPLPSSVLGPRCVCSPDNNYRPANYDCGCLKGEEKVGCSTPGNCSSGACLPCPGTPGSDCSRCSNGIGNPFPPPAKYSGQPTVRDVVKVPNLAPSDCVHDAARCAIQVPSDLPPGKYVLGFRYDCEATAQVWSNCADITLVR